MSELARECKVTQMHVSYSAKMSRNYQSADASCGVTVELGEGDDPISIAEEWNTKLKPFVHATCRNGLSELK
jgi:hypothetical protein